MSRTPFALVTFALLAVALSGCLGGDAVDSGLPTAKVTVTEVAGEPYTFVFDASASTGRGLAYAWDFGDGETGNEAVVEHTFPGDEEYDVSLIITDAEETTAVWSRTLKVGTGINSPPEATFKLSSRYLQIGEALTVDASATEDLDDSEFTYSWDFNFPFNQNDYLKFRAAKMDAEPAAQGGGEGGSDNSSGEGIPTGAPDLPTGAEAYETATGLLGRSKDAGHCHGPCSIDQTPSFEVIKAETSEPVYTLTEGLPEATIFYIKLQVRDVKGGFQAIVSEEIFPVQVVASKEADFVTDTFEASLTLGAPSTVTDNTPDVEGVPYDDEHAGDQAWTITVPKPILQGQLDITWVAATDDAIGSSIDISVRTAQGSFLNATGPNNQTTGGITIKVADTDELGTGDWKLSVWARMGVQIDYVATYHFTLDMNPFRDLEAPYL